MRLVATTVVRESVRGKQKTGYIYDVDWDSRRIEQRLPVPDPNFPESDDNPRGGVRGGRGVAATPHGIVVANYDTLHVYGDGWTAVDELTHPLFVGIHEIDWDGSHVWAAATALDAVLKIDLETRDVEAAWDPHTAPGLEGLALQPRRHSLDGSIDYRVREAPLLNQCHVNGVARRGEATIVNCGLVRKQKPPLARTAQRIRKRLGVAKPAKGRHSARSLVVELAPEQTPRVLVELNGHDFPTHNGQLLPDGRLAVNDSTHDTLRVFEIGEGKAREALKVEVPGTWLRGLEPVASSRVFVGSAPASLVLVDVETGQIEDRLQLSEDPNEAVHGLAAIAP